MSNENPTAVYRVAKLFRGDQMFTKKDICARLPDVRREAVHQAVRKLCDNGILERCGGATWKMQYRRREGSTMPHKDGRGQHPNSRVALRAEWRITMASLRNLRHFKGIKPTAATELERAWGWGVQVPALSQD